MDSQPVFNADNVTAQTIAKHPLTDSVKQAVIDSVNQQRDAGNFMTTFELIDHGGKRLTNSERYQLVQWLEHLEFVTSGFDMTSDVLIISWGPMKSWRVAD